MKMIDIVRFLHPRVGNLYGTSDGDPPRGGAQGAGGHRTHVAPRERDRGADAVDERTTGDTHRGNLGLLTIRGEHGVDEVLNNNNRRNNRSRDIYVNEQNVIA